MTYVVANARSVQQYAAHPVVNLQQGIRVCSCRDADEILQLVAASMPPNTKLAVFDAVTSNTAVVLPIKQLVQLCHDR
jgi:selenocysteine lyase/cysteine desulfurase